MEIQRHRHDANQDPSTVPLLTGRYFPDRTNRDVQHEFFIAVLELRASGTLNVDKITYGDEQ